MKNSSKITLYRTCEDIPLWNFYKFTETEDLKYLTKELILIDGLEEVKDKLLEEYFLLTDNQERQYRIGLMDQIILLSNKHDSVSLMIQGIKTFDVRLGKECLDELISGLEKWNYKLDPKKELFGQIEKIENRIKGIITKIKLIESELEEIQKQPTKKEKLSLETQLLIVSRTLGLSYRINPKELPLTEFIAMQEECVRIQENIIKNGK